MLLKILLKFKLYLILILVIIISLVRSNINIKSKYNIIDETFYGEIESFNYKKDYVTFIIKGKEKIKCNYYFTNNEIIKMNYGDKVILKGFLKEPNNNTIPNTFNYKKYLNNNDIKYILNVTDYKVVANNNSIIYKIKNTINNKINFDKRGYIKAFILGIKDDIDSDTYKEYQKNGIVHIFSISGMHISFLSTILLIVLNKIYNKRTNILFVIFFLLFYMILTNYQPSIVRSIVFFSLLNIFKLFKIRISTTDTLILSIVIILLIYPKFINNIGFLYSTIISFSLLYYKSKTKKKYISNLLYASLISFIISLPITINTNYSINLLSIITNLIFIPLVTFIVYPIVLLTFIFPFLYNYLYFFIDILEMLSNLISNISIFIVVVPKMNILSIIGYYLFIVLIMKYNKKYLFILLIYIFSIKLITKYDFTFRFFYLDIGQGDMEVIKYNNNTIIIDTGGNMNYSYFENYIKFFNSIGVERINYLILTHGDYDHMGEAINLVNNFKVEKVIFNCGEYNDLEKELIKVLDKKKIKYYSCIKELNIDDNKLYFLQTEYYDNENDNSNVIYTELDGYKFMFMGDAGIEKEKDILEKYSISYIDVLKVGHHGSKTSSSKDFIDEINPKYSIISVGKNNRYGHPNKEVLNNLNKSKIYRTDQDGSIMFKIKNNKLKIETCSP